MMVILILNLMLLEFEVEINNFKFNFNSILNIPASYLKFEHKRTKTTSQKYRFYPSCLLVLGLSCKVQHLSCKVQHLSCKVQHLSCKVPT